MTLPKISIITPSFNQGKFLEETIQSVISQDYPNLEYIIIDGGSTDRSIEVIKKYEQHLSYWVTEKDNGQSSAINKGLRMATGEIVAWLNSDDVFVNGALQKVAECFLQNPSAELIYGKVENFYVGGKTVIVDPPEFETESFLQKVTIHQPGVFWKRKLHNRIGLLDENLHYLMDYDLWIRLFFNFECLKVNETFSRFRIHPTSKTTGNPPEIYLEYRKVLSRFFNSFERPDVVQKLEALGIYDNKENTKYALTTSNHLIDLKLIINDYIHQCAIQEYSFQHVANANKLLLASLNAQTFFRTLEFLIKNNLRIRSVTSLFR